MNIEHLMKHFINTDFRGNLVPILRSVGSISGERLIFKTFILDFDPEYLNFTDNIKMSTFFIQCILSLSGLRKVTKILTKIFLLNTCSACLMVLILVVPQLITTLTGMVTILQCQCVIKDLILDFTKFIKYI